MKKILTVLLLMVLSLSLCAPAFAETQFATTKDFLALLDYLEMSYSNLGIDQDGDEYILLRNPDEELDYDVNFFFDDDLEHTSIFAWNLITFDPADTLLVMHVCNMLNYQYRYACFYVDETDNTVTCSMNLIYRDDGVGLTNAQALLYMMGIIEDAMPSLQVYAK